MADVIGRVGPHGYIHGWIKAGAPGALAGDAAHEHLGTPSLSKAQRDAVERYQGSLYHQMDAYLNTGDIHAADDEMGSHVISEAEMRKQIALLDAAFKGAPPTTKPLIVYRGMTVPDTTPGTTWTDKTPVSTSTDRKIGDQYASWAADEGKPGAKTVRIMVPAGSKALSMMNMIGHNHPQAVEEREVLLPRGSRFRVVSVSGDVVTVELLPPGPAVRSQAHEVFVARTREICRSAGIIW